jgi:hypothetical protein
LFKAFIPKFGAPPSFGGPLGNPNNPAQGHGNKQAKQEAQQYAISNQGRK